MEKELKFLDKKVKYLAMLAPSFVAEFSYPEIILALRKAGFDKIVELTFGAKLVNRKYHEFLKSYKKLVISSVCPGIVQTILNKYPQYRENLMPFVSPMIATAKLCKKIYPRHKIVFISPCNMKKIEALEYKEVDYVIDYQQLRKFFKKLKINPDKKTDLKNITSKAVCFDKFYNDYTKIYPLAGGLSKTAHLKGIVGANNTEIIDGLIRVEEFLKNPDKKIKFLDANFCVAGCIGGPCLSHKLSLEEKKKRVIDYVKKAKREKIPTSDLGLLKKAKNLKLSKKY